MKERGVNGCGCPSKSGAGIQGGFRAFSQWVAGVAGSPVAFSTSGLIIFLWLVSGPFFHFSDTWQLIINTATTIVTFLMVFLIQNTQNRDTKAVQLKLDELIRSVEGARNRLVSLEMMTDEELETLENEFRRVREAADKRPRKTIPAEERNETKRS